MLLSVQNQTCGGNVKCWKYDHNNFTNSCPSLIPNIFLIQHLEWVISEYFPVIESTNMIYETHSEHSPINSNSSSTCPSFTYLSIAGVTNQNVFSGNEIEVFTLVLVRTLVLFHVYMKIAASGS